MRSRTDRISTIMACYGKKMGCVENFKLHFDHDTLYLCSVGAWISKVKRVIIYVWNSVIGEITMNSEVTKKHKAIKYDTCDTAERIGDVRKCLILVQAFGECNTTSTAYVQGNLSVLKILEKFKAAREEAHVLLEKDRTTEKI